MAKVGSSTGYSGTPLPKKLGIAAGKSMLVVGAPEKYWQWVSPVPVDVKVLSRPGKTKVDFIHLFVTTQKKFASECLRLREAMVQDGMMWISWPKKSSGVATDLTEDVIRSFALKNKLVDVKVCAVDETWSGLKLVIPVKLRK